MKSNSFSCFLIGLGAGAVAMLVLAPKSGKDTRRYLKRRVDDGQELIERSASKMQDALDNCKGTIKRTNKALGNVVDAGRSAFSSIM